MGDLPFVGDVVHVRGAEGVCSAALIMAILPDGRLRLRVFYRAPVTEAVGARDAEGEYHHESERIAYVNPDGTSRPADSWHGRYH